MIKIIDLETEHLTEYEKKYVFTEAPTEKERVNVKRISLRAPDKRTYDFRKGADDEPEEDATEEPAEDVTTDDNTDVVEDPGDDLTDPAEDEPEVPDEDLDTEETPTEDTADEDIVVDDETIETVSFNADNLQLSAKAKAWQPGTDSFCRIEIYNEELGRYEIALRNR